MGREFNFAELCRSSEPMLEYRDPRRSVMLHATIVSGCAAVPARVRNISTGGIMAECRYPGGEGDRVQVALRGLGELRGAVAWATEDRIGICFDAPVDPGTALRKPPPRNVQILKAPRQERHRRPALTRC